MAILEGKFIKNVGQVATLQMTQKWFLWLTRHHKSLIKWPFSWSRLHPSSCSLTGSVKDRGVLTTILSGCVIKWYDLKQLLLRQLYCKRPFSWSRLHPSSCSLTGSLEDMGVLTTILSGCVIMWYKLYSSLHA